MYGKSYQTKEEYQFRLDLFTVTYHDIMTHNMLNAESDGYIKGIN